MVSVRMICEENLQGRYELDRVDIAEGEQVIAAPSLIKTLPLPPRRFIGDMSHTEKILLGLGLRQRRIEPE